MEYSNELLTAINEAEYVLVGIGEEWSYSKNQLLKEIDIKNRYSKQYQTQLMSEQLCKNRNSVITHAYKNLLRLIGEKNYFLISTNLDRYPVELGFDEWKCVFPCGSYHLLQCPNKCADIVFDLTRSEERRVGKEC